MSSTAWAIDIDRDDVTRAEVVATETEVGPGEILMQIDQFAMTANNVTYAVFGKPAGLFGNDQGYWDFFADRDAPGRLPVWGFATVLMSDIEGVAPGDRFYGYYPMASHAVLMPGQVGPNGFADASPRRTTLPPIYNQYQRVDAIPDYRREHHDYWPVFRPLFLTGWLIADQFDDEADYGAEAVLVASASSKTATGFAHAMRMRARRPQLIGLTAKANSRNLATLGLYDSVLAYEDIGLLDGEVPSALVDMAGNAAVTRAVHAKFGDRLVKSIVVGKSHWNADADDADLPGPPREGFFAPGRSQKRIADWGAREFGERMGAAWLDFMGLAPTIATIEKRSGSDGALDAYREVIEGRADAKVGIVVEP